MRLQDGRKFLFTTDTSSSWFSSWWDALGALRRYGIMSPYRSSSAVKALLAKFARLYDPSFLSEKGVARSIETFAERVGLGRELTMRMGQDWALSNGMGQEWMGEIMEGSTRCNVSGYSGSRYQLTGIWSVCRGYEWYPCARCGSLDGGRRSESD